MEKSVTSETFEAGSAVLCFVLGCKDRNKETLLTLVVADSTYEPLERFDVMKFPLEGEPRTKFHKSVIKLNDSRFVEEGVARASYDNRLLRYGDVVRWEGRRDEFANLDIAAYENCPEEVRFTIDFVLREAMTRMTPPV